MKTAITTTRSGSRSGFFCECHENFLIDCFPVPGIFSMFKKDLDNSKRDLPHFYQ